MKTISKPLVQSFKTYAVSSKAFRRACIGIGQFTHKMEQVPTRRMGVKGAPTFLPLSDQRALESGANSLSEFILFSIAAGFLLWENARSAKKERLHETEQEKRLDKLEEQMSQLLASHKGDSQK